MTISKYYSKEEEIANTISHVLGIVLGVVGGYILLCKAIKCDRNWAIISVCAYLLGMLSSYIASTCYHGCKNQNKKEVLRKCDHAAIYLHIAGTYIPFILIVLRNEGAWGWSLFVLITLMAITGVIFSFTNLKDHSNIETICFVLMGCTILTAFKPLYDALSNTGRVDALYWLIGGGISYIVGALFYSWTKKKFMHTVFHLFVLGGSICHMIAIYIIL